MQYRFSCKIPIYAEPNKHAVIIIKPKTYTFLSIKIKVKSVKLQTNINNRNLPIIKFDNGKYDNHKKSCLSTGLIRSTFCSAIVKTAIPKVTNATENSLVNEYRRFCSKKVKITLTNKVP